MCRVQIYVAYNYNQVIVFPQTCPSFVEDLPNVTIVNTIQSNFMPTFNYPYTKAYIVFYIS